MFCPYCLQPTSPPACSHCKEALPPMYVSRHGNPNGDPAILSIVGFSGHGKTDLPGRTAARNKEAPAL